MLDAVSSRRRGRRRQRQPTQLGRSVAPADKDGTLTFDAGAFKTALAANPAPSRPSSAGRPATAPTASPSTADDTVATDGVGARLSSWPPRPATRPTGMLTSLANGQDTQAKDIQAQIDDWTTAPGRCGSRP